MKDWQPIETAPKDGTRFIAYDSDTDGGGVASGLVIARWDDVREFDDEPPIFEWYVTDFDGGDVLGVNLTHWMPLPPPPNPS